MQKAFWGLCGWLEACNRLSPHYSQIFPFDFLKSQFKLDVGKREVWDIEEKELILLKKAELLQDGKMS